MAAEYIVSRGNYQVALCERGIRTFETMTRNTLDLNAVPLLKALTHLPVVVDPSHGIGLRDHVPPWRAPASRPARTGSSWRSTRARRRPSPTASSRSRRSSSRS